ncbi:hypothetical protein PR202_ga06922 [Eleusine coracana subsp. coracana]|uniref:Plastocyanin-like domain-containing protein n=1 Tax=Eleusine coracana subsp. coracana TaxID=191504 RepID=A0AAV5BXB9_ELECO|nr:hypothetical protein PR202_ga06922 [Eleusine coracana subsp. coracana]
MMVPEMADQNDMVTSFYFRNNQTSLCHPRLPPVPTQVDEHLFITLGLGSICSSVATMNNVSLELPVVTTPLLEAHYYNTSGMANKLIEIPERLPRMFNFTDRALIPEGPEAARLESTSKATLVRWFRHGAVVEMVLQSTAVLQSESNPMHLHGHDMFVLARGLGNYDAARDVARYNLLNPPVKNTVLVPSLGWVAVRFVADNPGVWYMHCHYEFHLSMGMTALIIVEDGPTVDTSLPPPPADFRSCITDGDILQDEFYFQSKKSEISRV